MCLSSVYWQIPLFSVVMPSPSGQPLRRLSASRTSRHMLPAYWAEASSERRNGTWTLGSCKNLKCTTCSTAGRKTASKVDSRYGHILLQILCCKYNMPSIANINGNGIFINGTVAHTDYRDWHSRFYSLADDYEKVLHLLTLPGTRR